MIDVDEIRKEIAMKHGTLLGENDPILILATMNEILLRQSLETLHDQNEAHQRAFSAALDIGVQESKKFAGRLITEGAEYVTEQCKTAISEAMDHALKKAKEEIRKDLEASKDEVRSTKVAAMWAASVFAVVFSVMLVGLSKLMLT